MMPLRRWSDWVLVASLARRRRRQATAKHTMVGDGIGAKGHLGPLAVVGALSQQDRAEGQDRRQQVQKGVLVQDRKGN